MNFTTVDKSIVDRVYDRVVILRDGEVANRAYIKQCLIAAKNAAIGLKRMDDVAAMLAANTAKMEESLKHDEYKLETFNAMNGRLMRIISRILLTREMP